MQSRSIINLNYSGSTLATVLIKDKTVYCTNVGDSRAVIGSHKRSVNFKNMRESVVPRMHIEDKIPIYLASCWVAHALSLDHKLENQEERDRIVSRGGRIAEMTELDPDTGL